MTQHLADTVDKRVQRTRRALFDSFVDLVLTEEYETIQVVDIIERAGVARSTFYQHFSNKDRILIDSMDPILTVIAAHICGRPEPERMTWVLEHFWENRQLARVVLSGQPYSQVRKALAQRVHVNLSTGKSRSVPLSLQSTRKAAGALATIREWLTGNERCSAARLAAFLGQGGD